MGGRSICASAPVGWNLRRADAFSDVGVIRLALNGFRSFAGAEKRGLRATSRMVAPGPPENGKPFVPNPLSATTGGLFHCGVFSWE